MLKSKGIPYYSNKLSFCSSTLLKIILYCSEIFHHYMNIQKYSIIMWLIPIMEESFQITEIPDSDQNFILENILYNFFTLEISCELVLLS